MQPTREYIAPITTVIASVKTDPGCVRETNEDNGRHVSQFSPEKSRHRGTLTIVADGMGGHSSGEIASEMAVELISQHFYDDKAGSITDALRGAIQAANSQIFRSSTLDLKYLGMGTTVVALVIHEGLGYAAHVGDSRLYRLRGVNMERLTVDHSQVMEMVKMGIISFDEAQHHEDKNIILRAVGTQPKVDVEVSDPFRVDVDDQYMLCSDGLCDMADDEEIRAIWVKAQDIYAASEALISLAKQRGGSDNITVGIVQVSATDAVQPARKVPITREIGVL